MGAAASEPKQKASFNLAKDRVERGKRGEYQKSNLDGYTKMRTAAGKKTGHQLDKDVMSAVTRSIIDDGIIDLNEAKTKIMPAFADGPGQNAAGTTKGWLTCNERWAVRYALGEFVWEEAARNFTLESYKTLHVMDHDVWNKKITDAEEVRAIMQGPTLQELSSPAKKARGESANQIFVDGMMLSRAMLLACKTGMEDDGVIDAKEAVDVFKAAAADGTMTRGERWTMRFILSVYPFSDAAFNFLVEAMSKLDQSDSTEA